MKSILDKLPTEELIKLLNKNIKNNHAIPCIVKRDVYLNKSEGVKGNVR